MKKYLVSLVLFVLLVSCNKTNITEPEPGRRDYVWAVDTLHSPFNTFYGIWGASPDDVWIVGPGGDAENRLQHFDGKKWSAYSKERIVCCGRDLWGTARDNIWMVGEEGKIWHYDGKLWKENTVIKSNEGYINFWQIWGRNKNDIYAVGLIWRTVDNEQRGIVVHYNGSKWDIYYKADYNSQFNKLGGDETNTFVSGLRLTNKNGSMIEDSTYINRISDRKVSTIFSANESYNISPVNIGNKVYIQFGTKLYNYLYGHTFLVKDYSNYASGLNIYGRSMENIFLRMNNGIAHDNGQNIEYLYKFSYPVSGYGDQIDFGEYIFFRVLTQNYNLILRGEIKK
jgi:hypothetical protein